MAIALLALVACSTTSTSVSDSGAPTAGVSASSGLPTAVGSLPTSIATSSTVAPTENRAPSPTLPAPSALPSTPAPAATQAIYPTPLYRYPIGAPGRPLGDGFVIRHSYAAENTWFNPGWWHTAEDWYAIEGSTVGARVYAVADGDVVYAGANYPGRVVIVQHTDGLFSMYGHLDPALAVKAGQWVSRGSLIGTVGPDAPRAPGHLHFEIRAFLTQREVNGAAPRYGYRCGVNCPPGPGYWPIDAPDHPSDLGWRNPTHVIAGRAFAADASGALGEVVVASRPASSSVTLWSAPPGSDEARQSLGDLELQPDEQFQLLGIQAGPEDSRGTSAEAYRLWYRIRLPDGRDGWVEAVAPSSAETGSDGRPSSIAFNFFPFTTAAP